MISNVDHQSTNYADDETSITTKNKMISIPEYEYVQLKTNIEITTNSNIELQNEIQVIFLFFCFFVYLIHRLNCIAKFSWSGQLNLCNQTAKQLFSNSSHVILSPIGWLKFQFEWCIQSLKPFSYFTEHKK